MTKETFSGPKDCNVWPTWEYTSLPAPRLSTRVAPPVATLRPITRKFAAQMAGKQQQPLPEEANELVQPVQVHTESEDVTIIDMDEYKAACDSPVPMFVQHTEAMLEEIDSSSPAHS